MFATMFKGARASRRMTQAQLAERLGLGQQAISAWERGKSRPESPDEVRSLAALFPEHSVAKWLKAAAYRPRKVTTQTEAVPLPVRPLLDELPLSSLSWEQFQDFSAALLAAQHPGAKVNQFGGAGDKQDGIDLEVIFGDGKYLTYQCKRENEFGAAKVRRAIAAHKVSCDRAYIFLSRNATAPARNAVPKRSRKKWTLHDSKDIARQVRELHPTKALQLIDVFFPQYRKGFLGVDDPSAFEPTARYFAPLLRRDRPFSHAWTLVGREVELSSIASALAQPADHVTILVGSGGIGKSRAVLAAAEAHVRCDPSTQVLVLPASGQPTAQDFDHIGLQINLLIIEDAHERTDLRAIFHAVIRSRRPQRVLISTRPYALQMVKGDAMAEGFIVSDSGVINLTGLSVDQAEVIAREILTEKNGPLDVARHIARVTHDSPFAVVVGTYLVATHRIHPDTLNNVKEFQTQLLTRFRDAVTGDIAPKGEEKTLREMLNLIALIRPVDPESPSFKELSSKMIPAPVEEARRAFHLLSEAGVLVRRGRHYRILPDLLSDAVLEQSCVANGQLGSHGYVERALEHADADAVARIVVNISSLDWRLSSADQSAATIVDAVWSPIEQLYKSDPEQHSVLLEGVAKAAYFQPRRALAFYDRAKHAEAENDTFAGLLRSVAMHLDYTDQACARLWELGKNDERRLGQYPSHPVRVLTELAGVKPGKPVEFCERIVQFAIRKLSVPDDAQSHYTLFEVLDAALAAEGSTTESKGYAFTIGRFAVRRAAVAAMRARIIDFLLSLVGSAALPTAARATVSLGNALKHPMNVSKEDFADWNSEFCETMRKMATIMSSPQLDPILSAGLARTVRWHTMRGVEPTDANAWSVIDAIPRSLAHRVTFALCDSSGLLVSRPGRDITSVAGIKSVANEWRLEQRNIAEQLLERYPDPVEVLRFLEGRIESIRLAQDSHASPSSFVGILTDSRPDLALAICESVMANPEGPFCAVFGQSLFRLTQHEPDRAVAIGVRAVEGGDLRLIRLVASAYRARLWSHAGLASERALVERLAQSSDDDTVGEVVNAVGAQMSSDPSWAIATLLRTPMERSAKIADAVVAVFARPDVSVDSLEAETFEALLGKLAKCPSLEEYWIQEFLISAAARVPHRLVELFIERMQIDPDGQDISSAPIPHWFTAQLTPDFRVSGEVSHLLPIVREWLLSAGNTVNAIYYGPKLYAMIAGQFDQVIVSDLEAWIKSGDRKKLGLVARILSVADKAFIFENVAFVVDLLERVAVVGDDCLNEMMASLAVAAASGVRQGMPGVPFPADEDRRARALRALEQLPRGSPAWSLYNGIRQDADASMRWKHDMDEELFDD
jgi:transcriptional regulator with XRE-family HTH domain